MRGIVMEKNNNKIIVLTDNGQFLEIKSFNDSIQIGQEVHFNNKVYNQSFIKKAVSIAAAFLVMVFCGYGVYGYYMPFGYVDVDINPSVELSYNLYDRVIDIKGLNEDGNHIIQKIDSYKNKPVKDIITKVIDRAIEEKYIKPEEKNAILVTITEAGSKIDDEEILQSVDNHMKNEKLETEVVVIKSDKNEYEAAKESNISPGKQILINKALKSSNTTNHEDMQNKSVKEIMSIIKENKKEDKKEEKDNKINNNSKKINNQNKKNKGNSDSKEINQNSNSNKNNSSNNKNLIFLPEDSKENREDKDIKKENNKGKEKEAKNKDKNHENPLKENNSSNRDSDKNNKRNNGNSKHKIKP